MQLSAAFIYTFIASSSSLGLQVLNNVARPYHGTAFESDEMDVKGQTHPAKVLAQTLAGEVADRIAEDVAAKWAERMNIGSGAVYPAYTKSDSVFANWCERLTVRFGSNFDSHSVRYGRHVDAL